MKRITVLMMAIGLVMAVAAPASAATPEEMCNEVGGIDVLAYQYRDGAFFTTPGTTLTINPKWTRETVVSSNPVAETFIGLHDGTVAHTAALKFSTTRRNPIEFVVVCGLPA